MINGSCEKLESTCAACRHGIGVSSSISKAVTTGGVNRVNIVLGEISCRLQLAHVGYSFQRLTTCQVQLWLHSQPSACTCNFIKGNPNSANRRVSILVPWDMTSLLRRLDAYLWTVQSDIGAKMSAQMLQQTRCRCQLEHPIFVSWQKLMNVEQPLFVAWWSHMI